MDGALGDTSRRDDEC